jgi:hypothetical protein
MHKGNFAQTLQHNTGAAGNVGKFRQQFTYTRQVFEQRFILWTKSLHISRGEFRPRQTRQLPRAVDLEGRFLFIVVKC